MANADRFGAFSELMAIRGGAAPAEVLAGV